MKILPFSLERLFHGAAASQCVFFCFCFLLFFEEDLFLNFEPCVWSRLQLLYNLLCTARQ